MCLRDCYFRCHASQTTLAIPGLWLPLPAFSLQNSPPLRPDGSQSAVPRFPEPFPSRSIPMISNHHRRLLVRTFSFLFHLRSFPGFFLHPLPLDPHVCPSSQVYRVHSSTSTNYFSMRDIRTADVKPALPVVPTHAPRPTGRAFGSIQPLKVYHLYLRTFESTSDQSKLPYICLE